MRRLAASGIGGERVAREREGLAATPAPIDFTAIAPGARRWHPVRAAEAIKGIRSVPDVQKRVVTDRREGEVREAFSGMARQHQAHRRDGDEAPAPAAHAGFGQAGIIVRHDIVDHHRPGEALARCLDLLRGSVQLTTRGQQRVTIGQSPTVILHMGHLDPGGTERDRHVQHICQGYPDSADAPRG